MIDTNQNASELVQFEYDDKLVRWFSAATVLWGLVGMLVGIVVAAQLAMESLNFGPYFTFGRLRPLHTNAVIFAFVGNMIFAGIYYSTQRLCKTAMASPLLGKIHFWGWQAIIVSAAITLPLGMTQSKEYAELEWPIDIAVTLIWVVFAVNFFWTLYKRREKHLYVALWFYIATILTVAMLYIVNNLALPVFGAGLAKSYPIFAGVQDALVQWWYGHNAVAFFLTTPVLGIMYYFLPKAVERPVYSYRLSIVHFWALVFVYIWAGPHHLLYTALPEWAQSMGMVFSLMLWAPSWGGMLNGLLTLRGAWDKLRTDPLVKFLIAGVTFYGMATFEGPLLSIKSVSALGHYTDWIIGHVHSGALGWNGLMAAGMLYWLVPRLWGTKLHSTPLANFHFWIATLGILLYAGAMWFSGITQGLMWRAESAEGALLYPNFVETLIAIRPMYWMRLVGGTMYFAGFIIFAYNLVMTAKSGAPVVQKAEAVQQVDVVEDSIKWTALVFSWPVVISTGIVVLTISFLGTGLAGSIIFGIVLAALGLGIWVAWGVRKNSGEQRNFHHILEGRPLLFTVLTALAVVIGGVVEIVPTLVTDRAVPKTGPQATPYRPLELQGRDIYVREGCYNCHSQMVRPFRSEHLRYKNGTTGLSVSHASEFTYDHPFQWGSKRTGPDLHRVGQKYPNLWHYRHMIDPSSTSEGTNMPSYAFMKDERIDNADTVLKMKAMKTLGVPYSASAIGTASATALAQAKGIAKDLESQGVEIDWTPEDQAVTGMPYDSELVALIAYLQRLGTHPAVPDLVVKAAPAAKNDSTESEAQ